MQAECGVPLIPLVITREVHDSWISQRCHPRLGENVDYFLQVDWPPMRSACCLRMTINCVADLALQTDRQPRKRQLSTPIELRDRRPIARRCEPVIPANSIRPTAN